MERMPAVVLVGQQDFNAVDQANLLEKVQYALGFSNLKTRRGAKQKIVTRDSEEDLLFGDREGGGSLDK